MDKRPRGAEPLGKRRTIRLSQALDDLIEADRLTKGIAWANALRQALGDYFESGEPRCPDRRTHWIGERFARFDKDVLDSLVVVGDQMQPRTGKDRGTHRKTSKPRSQGKKKRQGTGKG